MRDVAWRLLPRRRVHRLIVAMFALSSCTGVQWVDGHGEIRLLGLGRVEPVAADGGLVTRVVTPGMSLRAVPSGYRYSVGWADTTFFQSTPADGPREMLAMGDRIYGIALDPSSVVVGTEQRFVILEPDGAKPVVQEIRYQSGRPSSTWLRRKEGQ
jgi:hypothetical protein